MYLPCEIAVCEVIGIGLSLSMQNATSPIAKMFSAKLVLKYSSTVTQDPLLKLRPAIFSAKGFAFTPAVQTRTSKLMLLPLFKSTTLSFTSINGSPNKTSTPSFFKRKTAFLETQSPAEAKSTGEASTMDIETFSAGWPWSLATLWTNPTSSEATSEQVNPPPPTIMLTLSRLPLRPNASSTALRKFKESSVVLNSIARLARPGMPHKLVAEPTAKISQSYF